MIKYFFIEESPYKPGKYTIRMDFDKFPNISTSGSYNVLPARLMGISYPDYCRACRDLFGAEIIGKGEMYPVVYFKRTSEVQMLVNILNKRMELIMKLKEINSSPELIKLMEEWDWEKEYTCEFGNAPNFTIKVGEA